MPEIVKTLADDFSTLTNFTPRVGAVTRFARKSTNLCCSHGCDLTKCVPLSCSKIILNVLSENGHHRTALRAATTTQAPSWGWWWTQNATTCWEAFPGGGGTRNHIFLCGGYGHWLWKHLVGLDRTRCARFESGGAPAFRGDSNSSGLTHPVLCSAPDSRRSASRRRLTGSTGRSR